VEEAQPGGLLGQQSFVPRVEVDVEVIAAVADRRGEVGPIRVLELKQCRAWSGRRSPS
jgi:hypothetical protein